MSQSDAERSRAYRDRKRGAPPTLKPCGTYAAAIRHRRNGEPVDAACAAALAEYQAAQHANRKAR